MMYISSNHEQIFPDTPTLFRMSLQNTIPDFRLFPAHWHKGLELLFIDKGALEVTLQKTTYVARSGDIVVINPNVLHVGYTREAPSLHRVLILELENLCGVPELAALMRPYIKNTASFLPLVRDDKMFDIADKVFSLPESGEPELDFLRTTAAYRLLYRLYTYHTDKGYTVPSQRSRMQRVLDYIDEHYCENITVKQLSTIFQYEETYFGRLFKTATSLSLTEYVRILRLEKAKRLLRSENMEIAAVAEQCGFSDMNYFSRCFKKRQGMTAGEYRKSKRNT